MRRKMLMRTAVAGLALALAAPAAASAAEYPAPGDPGKVRPRPGGGKTFKVCTKQQARALARARRGARGPNCSPTIQAAVDKTLPGDTVKVPAGTYGESVTISGHRHDAIKLIGSPSNPRKTVIDVGSLNRNQRQNAVMINSADGVTVKGFYGRNYLGNGFFAVNVTGYTFTKLVAGYGGTYGIYAFHSKGGTISDSEAFYNNDAGYYIGETPKQSKPIRSTVTNVRAWGNQLGFSGTNMRYTTITKSQWYNNGLGIVPNALDSEKFPPAEDNVIVDNDVFWNNFNYFRGAPFEVRGGAKGLAYPVGSGILLYGSQNTTIEGNRVWGHFLFGVGAVDAIELRDADQAAIRGITVKGNAFGRDGTDLNNYDLFYPGRIRGANVDNCFSDNSGVQKTLPLDGSTLKPCPFTGEIPLDQSAYFSGLAWLGDRTHEAAWVRHSHPPFEGITPLVHYTGKKK
ncbi:right-handed parallel beta-helix repeat-containing protein [Conexibacter sp. CPCC 206217]|uniref:NosD domain-containing protein n=1 Tax=Conexibacter sp. CPCC 206217 TaxID=3064574 RepID=UPI002719C7A7|nr:right-handed parallel beta-helix repeat-containing protein [Conexibacter sp. CPCC 206217]MDO8212912.1 right-handed parallel beta-helix repeat-containing protein [Conexibacter sp. CPCC 206217]